MPVLRLLSESSICQNVGPIGERAPHIPNIKSARRANKDAKGTEDPGAHFSRYSRRAPIPLLHKTGGYSRRSEPTKSLKTSGHFSWAFFINLPTNPHPPPTHAHANVHMHDPSNPRSAERPLAPLP